MNFAMPQVPLLFLVLSIFAIAALVWSFKRGRGRISLLRVLLRVLIVAILLLVGGGAYVEDHLETSQAFVLLDVSESMDVDVADQLLNDTRTLESESLAVQVLPFSGSATGVQTPLKDVGSYRNFQQQWSRLDLGKSNLEAGLRGVLARGGSSVLLISDAHETLGDVERLTPLLSSSSAKVFPLTPAANADPDSRFSISYLHAPLLAPALKSVEVRTSLRNTTASAQSGLLTLTHDGKTLLSENVTVPPGEELLVLAESNPSSEGIKEIVATLKPDDTSHTASTMVRYLSGEEREKILLLSGSSEDEELFARALENQSYRVEKQAFEGSGLTVKDLEKFSLVVFNNVSRKQLASGAIRSVDRYVREGGSFLMVGGNRSFGLGGYLDTQMEEILPVRMVPPQTVKKRLNVGVVLVLDKSRSMAFGNKIEYAKDAAREVVRNLKDDDFVSVIGFDSTPFPAVPITQIRGKREWAMGRIGRLFPAGKTNLFPAIDDGRRGLATIQAGRKHMIVLTDGKIPDAGPYYLELVRQMRLEGITLSTVMMGGHSDVMLLREMATIGRGAFYQTTNAQSLPRIFLSDIKVNTGERTMKENEEYSVRRGPGFGKATQVRTFPPLRGFVQASAKQSARTELVIMDVGKAYPLFAVGNYGEGKSAAFTSDANGRWSSYWVRWPGYSRFWTDTIDFLRPEKDELASNIRFSLGQYVNKGMLELDLSVYTEGVTGAVSTQLLQPDGTEREVVFNPVSYGRYKAQVENVLAGKHELRVKIGKRKLTPVAFYLSGELFGEIKGKGFNLPVLTRLASLTGGAFNPSAEEVRTQVYTKTIKKSLAVPLLIFALFLLLLDILFREISQVGAFRRRKRGAKKGRSTKRQFSLRPGAKRAA
jgi:uncharacterized membrane protein